MAYTASSSMGLQPIDRTAAVSGWANPTDDDKVVGYTTVNGVRKPITQSQQNKLSGHYAATDINRPNEVNPVTGQKGVQVAAGGLLPGHVPYNPTGVPSYGAALAGMNTPAPATNPAPAAPATNWLQNDQSTWSPDQLQKFLTGYGGMLSGNNDPYIAPNGQPVTKLSKSIGPSNQSTLGAMGRFGGTFTNPSTAPPTATTDGNWLQNDPSTWTDEQRNKFLTAYANKASGLSPDNVLSYIRDIGTGGGGANAQPSTPTQSREDQVKAMLNSDPSSWSESTRAKFNEGLAATLGMNSTGGAGGVGGTGATGANDFTLPMDLQPSSGALPEKYREQLLSALMPELISSIGNMRGDADKYMADAGNMYSNIFNKSLKQGMPDVINNLANRGVLDSSVASDAISKYASQIASEQAGKGYETGSNAALMKFGIPNVLRDVAGLGQYSEDPTAMWDTLSGLLQSQM